MSQLVLYNEIKTALEAITGIQHVSLWNNQFANENQENAFLYPCVFIQFTDSNFQDLTKGVQMYDCLITLHIGFESYEDTDTDILTLKQTIFAAMHRLQTSTTATMLMRVDERQNFDHSNVQAYEQDYKVTVKDFTADNRASTSHTVTTLTITETIQ
jgi:hypothetical protein